ncbi:MerR family transcriptional regulator [Actinomadura sp. NEAU-AAG7]|uniref:MerR family transcriptional regulator n=2 Tax=Actinomadura litoris TaxID=2678616 RepID=A0A7K1LAL8_9ACTN|nr:MerR family transcriptional regulator [Actinomadura sp. NEAU-AAG7]MBT2213313.1 MerR family transcriptional regulator [Actinomadura sp. NEAU-AAG7]MUN41286.1 MerR family transcriptional regulator [Actinomadura litoris]
MLIGELAVAAGTTTRALRYYEQHGLLHSRRTGNGYRHYDARALTRVRNIRRLLALGFTSDDVRRFLPCLDDHDLTEQRCAASVEFVTLKLAALDERIAELNAIRGQLQGFLDSAGENPAMTG